MSDILIYKKQKTRILFTYGFFFKAQILRALLSNKMEFYIFEKSQ